MATAQRVIRNLYRDSVSLMQFSQKLSAFPGVIQASAVMATENNINLLQAAGLLKVSFAPSPNDMLIVIEGSDERALDAILNEAEAVLKQKPTDSGDGGQQRIMARSIEIALAEMPGANLALISTPGEYAAAEALKALHLGLNAMLFSDNVSIDDEIALKQYARDHGLLVMGPDCGTAIINGVPLGFANVVRRGDIGLVAASGTGLQQVSSLIDRWGVGVSQAIGIGSHDLHTRVEGISMLQGIEMLAADPATRVIVLISKPPSPQVATRVLERAAQSGKPVVVDFIGADPTTIVRTGIAFAQTLEDAAAMAVALSLGKEPRHSGTQEREMIGVVGTPAPTQKYIRGLFSGGTFCFETLLLLSEKLGPIYSNVPLKPERRLKDVWQSQQHTAIDLGDDLFTQGRPHPMIDFRLRNERILKEAADPEVRVILLDVVLGYGSHMDPAGELVPTIAKAKSQAADAGRNLVFVGSVCGTTADPQNLNRQEDALRAGGVLLAESNAQAARLAAEIVSSKN